MSAKHMAGGLLTLGVVAVVATAAACGGKPGVPSSERGPREYILDDTCQFFADEVTLYFDGETPTRDVQVIVSEYGATVRREFDLPGTWVLKVDPGQEGRAEGGTGEEPGREIRGVGVTSDTPRAGVGKPMRPADAAAPRA